MENDLKLLNVMLIEQSLQLPIYSPGPYWKGYCKGITKAIKRDGILNFRANHAIGKGFADTVAFDPSSQWDRGGWKLQILKKIVNNGFIKKKIVDFYLRLIQTHYERAKKYRQYYYSHEFKNLIQRYDLPDTTTGGCIETVEIDGVDISILYLKHLKNIDYFKDDLSQVKTIIEIGGGFGATAHLILHIFPNIEKYIYLDILPMLYIAHQYLGQFNYGNRLKIIPPWELSRIDSKIDLLWNSASFQEMEVDIIENYIKYLKKLGVNRVCLIGSRLLKTHPNIDWVNMFEYNFPYVYIK